MQVNISNLYFQADVYPSDSFVKHCNKQIDKISVGIHNNAGLDTNRRINELTQYVVTAKLSLKKTASDPNSRVKIAAEIEKTLTVMGYLVNFYPGCFNQLPSLSEVAKCGVTPSLRFKLGWSKKSVRTQLVSQCMQQLLNTNGITLKARPEFYQWRDSLKAHELFSVTFDLSAYNSTSVTIFESNKAWVVLGGVHYHEVSPQALDSVQQFRFRLMTVVKGNEFSFCRENLVPVLAVATEYWNTGGESWKQDLFGRNYQFRYQDMIAALKGIISPECKLARSFNAGSAPFVIELFGGNGELAEQVLKEFPEVNYALYDLNNSAIQDAKKRLAPFAGRVSIHRDNALTVDLKKYCSQRAPDVFLISGGLTPCVLENAAEAEAIVQNIYHALPPHGFLILNGEQEQWLDVSILREYFTCHNTIHPCLPEQLYILQKRSRESGNFSIRNSSILTFFSFMNLHKPGSERLSLLAQETKVMPENVGLDLSGTNVTPEELELLLKHCKKTHTVILRGVHINQQHLNVLGLLLPECHLDLSMTPLTAEAYDEFYKNFGKAVFSLSLRNCPNMSETDQAQRMARVASNNSMINLIFLGELNYRDVKIVDRAVTVALGFMRNNTEKKLLLKHTLPSDKLLSTILKEFGFDRILVDATALATMETFKIKRRVATEISIAIGTFGLGSRTNEIEFPKEYDKEDLTRILELISAATTPESRKKIVKVKAAKFFGLVPEIKKIFPNAKIAS